MERSSSGEESQHAATPTQDQFGLAPPASLLSSLLRAQLALAVLSGFVGLASGGRDTGLNALWGGAIAWSGTLLALGTVFVFRSRSALGALGAQMLGEGVKIVWTILMFWLALRRPEARPLPLIAGFCVALLGYIVGPALSLRRRR